VNKYLHDRYLTSWGGTGREGRNVTSLQEIRFKIRYLQPVMPSGRRGRKRSANIHPSVKSNSTIIVFRLTYKSNPHSNLHSCRPPSLPPSHANPPFPKNRSSTLIPISNSYRFTSRSTLPCLPLLHPKPVVMVHQLPVVFYPIPIPILCL
jgi:hypothetical protein